MYDSPQTDVSMIININGVNKYIALGELNDSSSSRLRYYRKSNNKIYSILKEAYGKLFFEWKWIGYWYGNFTPAKKMQEGEYDSWGVYDGNPKVFKMSFSGKCVFFNLPYGGENVVAKVLDDSFSTGEENWSVYSFPGKFKVVGYAGGGDGTWKNSSCVINVKKGETYILRGQGGQLPYLWHN